MAKFLAHDLAIEGVGIVAAKSVEGVAAISAYLGISSIIDAITSNVRFFDSDFAASIVVYEEDFEDSNDTLLAPPVQREPPNKYFNNYSPNYNNT